MIHRSSYDSQCLLYSFLSSDEEFPESRINLHESYFVPPVLLLRFISIYDLANSSPLESHHPYYSLPKNLLLLGSTRDLSSVSHSRSPSTTSTSVPTDFVLEIQSLATLLNLLNPHPTSHFFYYILLKWTSSGLTSVSPFWHHGGSALFYSLPLPLRPYHPLPSRLLCNISRTPEKGGKIFKESIEGRMSYKESYTRHLVDVTWTIFPSKNRLRNLDDLILVTFMSRNY